MKKLFIITIAFISHQAQCSMLSSAIFSGIRETKTTFSDVCKTKTTESFFSNFSMGSWSCESIKEAIYNTTKDTLEPLTTFSYDNVTLAVITTTAIAYVSYKAGKYAHMPAYKPEDVQRVVVVAAPAPAPAARRRLAE